MTQLTDLEVGEALLSDGWKPENVELIIAHLDRPIIGRAMRKLASKILTVPYISARKTPKPKAGISANLRRAVFERDAYRCRHCSTWIDLSVDHVVPESLGGITEISNLQTLCMSCNTKKGNRFIG